MAEKKIEFEEGLERLAQIVRQLEAGNTPLDKSLELYEEGVKLVKLCSKAIENAEKKVKILVAKENGLSEEDFDS